MRFYQNDWRRISTTVVTPVTHLKKGFLTDELHNINMKAGHCTEAGPTLFSSTSIEVSHSQVKL